MADNNGYLECWTCFTKILAAKRGPIHDELVCSECYDEEMDKFIYRNTK